MCGIMITRSHRYDGSMKHRGITTRERKIGKLKFVHEHLPIQATIDENSIIETDGHIILFNGELFDVPLCFKSDLDFIEDLWSAKNMYSTDKIEVIFGMDGFYSFIIYDKRSGEITAFTDPLGKKQLYMSKDGIASEIRPLVTTNMTHDKFFKAHTIKFGYVTDDSTPYNQIKRLEPNKIFKFGATLNLKNVYDSPHSFKDHTVRVSPPYIRSLVEKAVKNRLIGHQKIGLLLSGGLDSSIIYHHVKALGYEVTTYCVDNEDDLKYARMMDPDVIVIEEDFVDPDVALEAMEMPLDLGSMYAQYALFEAVKETVILTGDGADEVFGGYRRMKQYDSQRSDIFDELPYYHNIRLDRMSMIHTKEVRSPFMALDIVEYAMGLPYKERMDKAVLRKAYEGILPNQIVNRPKEPLKSDTIRKTDPVEYRARLYKCWEEL